MTVTINGTTGVSLCDTNSVPTAAIQASAVTQPKVGSGVAGNGPAFSAYRAGSTYVPFTNNTWTKVILDTEAFDTNNNFDTSTYRFTPTVAGYYQIQSCTSTTWGNSQYGAFYTAIYKNGVVYKRSERLVGTSVYDYGSINVQDLIYLNGTTDYVEIYAYSSGGTNPAYNEGSIETYMSGFLARAA